MLDIVRNKIFTYWPPGVFWLRCTRNERSDAVYAVSGMIGLGQWVAAKRTNHVGRVRLSSDMSLSGVLMYGSDSKTPERQWSSLILRQYN